MVSGVKQHMLDNNTEFWLSKWILQVILKGSLLIHQKGQHSVAQWDTLQEVCLIIYMELTFYHQQFELKHDDKHSENFLSETFIWIWLQCN